jgi:hypothetical protein
MRPSLKDVEFGTMIQDTVTTYAFDAFPTTENDCVSNQF